MAGFKPVANLIELALAGPAQGVALETFQAFPMPVRHAAGLRLAFLYCPSRSKPATGRLLLPPRHLAHLDAATGGLLLLRAVSPGEVGPAAPPDQPLGRHAIGEGMTREEFEDRRKRLLAAVDLLLPSFAANRMLVAEDVRQAAGEFPALFECLGEAPIAPYHRDVGREFFDWLATVAPRGRR